MPRIQVPICTADGCARRSYALDFCMMHRRRFMVHGDPAVGGRRHWTPEDDKALLSHMHQFPVPRDTWTGVARKLRRTHKAVGARVFVLRHGRRHPNGRAYSAMVRARNGGTE